VHAFLSRKQKDEHTIFVILQLEVPPLIQREKRATKSSTMSSTTLSGCITPSRPLVLTTFSLHSTFSGPRNHEVSGSKKDRVLAMLQAALDILDIQDIEDLVDIEEEDEPAAHSGSPQDNGPKL
jgi:hypothetical protein